MQIEIEFHHFQQEARLPLEVELEARLKIYFAVTFAVAFPPEGRKHGARTSAPKYLLLSFSCQFARTFEYMQQITFYVPDVCLFVRHPKVYARCHGCTDQEVSIGLT